MTCGITGMTVGSCLCLSIILKLQGKAMYSLWKEEKMEKINIKFDEEQLEKVVKKVAEELKKTKPNFYELSDTKQEEKKKKSRVL